MEDTYLNDLFKDEIKIKLLKNANKILKLYENENKKIVFIYSHPKVGSTSLVSSLRIFCSNEFKIIHIHDEEMLKILGNINDITINEIILYNKFIGNEIFVIDIYRSPIERKISCYFEKIETLHFNTTIENLEKININILIERFNNIFNFIGNGDHFLDTFNLPISNTFDFINKFLLIKNNGINYIKLRLVDIEYWGNILTKLLGIKICLIKDNDSINKPIKKIYLNFKKNYKVPINYLNNLLQCKHFNYFFSEKEKDEYFQFWNNNEKVIGFLPIEFNIYLKISLENNLKNDIQSNHYFDEGCLCNLCNLKRSEVKNQIINGEKPLNKIIHKNIKEIYIKEFLDFKAKSNLTKNKKNLMKINLYKGI